MVVANRELREFLVNRRAQVTPEQVGLPSLGARRRVSGLRREEVALLAGVSPDYYARLERGQAAGASWSVLDAVARALQLDDTERQHLRALAGRPESAVRPSSSRPKPARGVRSAVLSILDGMTTVPAYLRTPQLDIVAVNRLGRALYDGVLDESRLPVNVARYLFLDPHSRGLFLDWGQVADDLVAALRLQAGTEPRDRSLSDLIGELSTRSDEFSMRWARQQVRPHRTARKRFHHSLVGDIDLTGDALELHGDGLVLIAYTAASGSPAAEQLQLLASWSATPAVPDRTDSPFSTTTTGAIRDAGLPDPTIEER